MQKTSIEWTDRSANPIRARHKVTGKVGWHCVKWSKGCASCYAEAINKRFGTGLPFVKSSADEVELFLDGRPLEALVRLRRPSRVFLCDMTDLFQEGVTWRMVDAVFAAMERARHHTFQILTKRADRMAAYVEGLRREASWWPLPNVWLGVSIEDQATADERIPHLLKVPASVRFLSVEPLLGPVDLTAIRRTRAEGYMRPLDGRFNRIGWVIVGGESGPGARPLHVDWIRSIVDQCREAGVPCFVKQMGREVRVNGDGGWPLSAARLESYGECVAVRLPDAKGGDPANWPADLRVRQFPHAVVMEAVQ
jgi:protein gp37